MSLLLSVACASCGASSHDLAYAPRPGDDLRVTRAVLYRNGIGYFERRGRIEGDYFTIHIRPDQIADVLKSITVVDLSPRGRAVSVALPVEKSQARRLADLPPQVRDGGGILAIASAFRGARAHVRAGSREATGRIVGIESFQTPAKRPGDPPVEEWRLTLLVDGRSLVAFPVSEIQALKILDRTLTVGLEKALDVSLNEGTWKPIALTVFLCGPGPHDLVVSYVVEMPTWKPAYRVVVGEEKDALLQGWAVVDNVSGEDWYKVALSLTAGTPLAFAYDLYTPHYVRRPDLSPPEEQAGLPPPPPPRPSSTPAPARGRYSKKAEARGPTGSAGGMPSADYAEEYEMEAPEPQPEVSEADLERNYQALVQGTGVGALFRYDLAEAVTVPDRASALVSIVSTRVPGEDGLLFRVGLDGLNPYRVVRLQNKTGFLLEGGPVAIYRQSTFLGEALIGRLEKEATAFVPYALDTRVDVHLEEARRDVGMQLVSIVNGRLIAESKTVNRFVYDVDNRSGETGTLWVQRGRRTGWTITKVGLAETDRDAPPQPGRDGVIEEKAVYFVPIALPATGHVRIAVEEETPARRNVEILSSEGREVVLAYVKSPDADPRVAKKLAEAVDISDRIATIERRLRDLNERRRMLGEREEEVRENLNLLRKTSENADLRRELAERLATLEKQLDELTREHVQLTEEKASLNERLVVMLKTLTLERK